MELGVYRAIDMMRFFIPITCCIVTSVGCEKSKPETKGVKISGDEIKFYNNIPQSSTHIHRALCLNYSKSTFYYWTISDIEVDTGEYEAKGTIRVYSDKIKLITDFGEITMIIDKDNSLVHHEYIESELSTQNGWSLKVSETANMNNPFRR